MILGMNFISVTDLTYSPVSQAFSFGTNAEAISVSAVSISSPSWEPLLADFPWPGAVALLAEDFYLPPHSSGVAAARLSPGSGSWPARTADVLLTVAGVPAVVRADPTGLFSVVLRNDTPEPQKALAGSSFGHCTSLHDCSAAPLSAASAPGTWRQWAADAHLMASRSPAGLPTSYAQVAAHSASPPTPPAVFDAIARACERSNLPPLHRGQLAQLLQRYASTISSGPYDLGRADAVQHSIRMRDTEPVFTKQFPLRPEDYAKIKEDVANWVRIGVVEPANSPYNSPIFTVRKKSGGLRCVLDYRKVNAASLPDRYSIRAVDECIREVGYSGAKVFSTMDLQCGFWQMPLHPDARDFTAFTLPGVGQMRWITSPMGLTGCPASFSRLIDATLRDVRGAMSYIDDILAFAPDWPAHLVILEQVLHRLATAHLKLNLDKCHFGQSQVDYLGHVISADGIRPSRDKTAALLALPSPSSIKSLRSFLGLANYFRSFIPQFSSIATPLFRLTRSNKRWPGGPLPKDASDAFHALRSALTTAPVLAYPNRSGEFHLFVDASTGTFTDDGEEGGLGACLLQDQPDGPRRIIGYASRRLQQHERNYPTGLLELAAVCYGIEFFEHYLRPNAFTVHTDHRPLCELSKVHKRTLQRFQAIFEHFNPKFLYIQGSANPVADFLSRNPLPASSLMASIPDVIALQRQEEEINRWRRYVASKTWNPRWGPRPKETDLMVVRDGLLVVDDGRPRTIAPAALRPRILAEAHDHLLAGHRGVDATLHVVAREFWWPTMHTEVGTHVRNCQVCQSTASALPAPVQPMRPLPACTGPNQRLHVDLWGPQKSKDGSPRYVLVMTCAFSKLVALAVLPDKSADTVAQAILHRWIFSFGVPRVLLSDQGLEFNNKVLASVCSSLEISYLTTSGYRPQTNGQAEVFNRSMASYLARMLTQAHRSSLDWETLIGPLQLSYNTATHKATRHSPFSILLGYNPRVPLWPEGEAVFQSDTPVEEQEAIANLRRTQLLTRADAFHHNQDARASYQAAHDASVDPSTAPSFQTGDLVWVRIQQTNEPNRKLAPKWEEGTISRVLAEDVYEVIRERRSRRRVAAVNVHHLRRREVPPAPSGPPSADKSPRHHSLLRRALQQAARAASLSLLLTSVEAEEAGAPLPLHLLVDDSLLQQLLQHKAALEGTQRNGWLSFTSTPAGTAPPAPSPPPSPPSSSSGSSTPQAESDNSIYWEADDAPAEATGETSPSTGPSAPPSPPVTRSSPAQGTTARRTAAAITRELVRLLPSQDPTAPAAEGPPASRTRSRHATPGTPASWTPSGSLPPSPPAQAPATPRATTSRGASAHSPPAPPARTSSRPPESAASSPAAAAYPTGPARDQHRPSTLTARTPPPGPGAPRPRQLWPPSPDP
jgi:hypothetical protein